MNLTERVVDTTVSSFQSQVSDARNREHCVWPPDLQSRILIRGAGPAGLSAAYYLQKARI